MKPQLLPPNVLDHYYAGGPRIAAFRGLSLPSDHMPEEWLAAVNTTFGAANGRGLSHSEDGTLVRDAIETDPEAWLGPKHVERFGADPALLTKLLDAGQRLSVHFHPGREFAKRELGLDHGKTEAWIIIEADAGAKVWVGWREDVSLETIREWMRTQDSAAMLAAMHELDVKPGDAIFVPAGTIHAIGAGILMVEAQEPTDLSISLEWNGYEIEEDDCHLGLGWDVALQALDRSGMSDAEVAGLRSNGTLLPKAADPYFRAERVHGGDSLDAGFSVLIGLSGEGDLGGIPVKRGSALVLPYDAGALELTGDVEAIRCRPPAPDTPAGRW
jgi:mannose-6-phosphate isomerase